MQICVEEGSLQLHQDLSDKPKIATLACFHISDYVDESGISLHGAYLYTIYLSYHTLSRCSLLFLLAYFFFLKVSSMTFTIYDFKFFNMIFINKERRKQKFRFKKTSGIQKNLSRGAWVYPTLDFGSD